ncbi:MAG: Bacteriohemerythrin [Stenotrophomonas maltophilia]|nr:MAG: Bacteriohemerythrin [Stenotrophomonas maltophilia]
MEYTWTNDLNTGVAVIDTQHKRILAALNQMLAAQETGDRAFVAEALEELVDYTLSHFAFEEALLEEVEYAETDNHKLMHAAFIARIDRFRQRFRAGEEIAEELASLLVQWLFNHIRQEDVLCVQQVRERMQQVTTDEHQDGWLRRTLGRIFQS